MDYINMALSYGGYTSLDKVYLERVLAGLTEEQKLQFITPPPSVINAYFAELYQKKSPDAATDYYEQVTEVFDLYQTSPSFEEDKPFVRLNLSGKAYGFCYREKGLAQVFAQQAEAISMDLLFEIAQIFPHYLVYEEERLILMRHVTDREVVETKELSALSQFEELADGSIRLTGYNQDELAQLARAYPGKIAVRSKNRTAMIYIS
ncbi:cystathionine beta-lyase [Streptococcus xiaochunlingii]|uniref:Cystathionine beta-lyase n=2 Tax=Streptococcus xiaochunlingii TaxID=2589788 RepID=A0ABY2YDC3_9STRE|nr:cystathionine beta-lyase [Streptococcus xiaochunlingii]